MRPETGKINFQLMHSMNITPMTNTIPFARSASYPVRSGNMVRLLVDSELAMWTEEA